MEIIEKAPAKINIGFDVLNKRADNYHEIETIMTSIDLSDYLTFTARNDEEIVIETENSFLPLDQNNHIYQAVECLREHAKIKAGVTINLRKKIPVAAGLAGGSSDAAATLRGLNKLWQLDYSLAQLAELGKMIGSDVPYCVYGKTSKATGTGTELKHLPKIPASWVVVVKPGVSISTAKIFEEVVLDDLLHPDIPSLERAIKNQDYHAMCAQMMNSLEEITVGHCPKIRAIKRCLNRLGADAVVMSGTGPTMLGFCHNRRKAEKIVNGLKGFCNEVYLVRTI